MTKTTKEIAQEWGCSERTVAKYCAEGLIPPAKKEGRKWRIPDEWIKPPLGRRSLCYLLDTIYQLKYGVDYSSLSFGFSEDVVKAGYDYLIRCAFMSSIDINNLKDTLYSAIVTPRGDNLIEMENRESKTKTEFKGYMKIKADVGIVSAEIGAEASRRV